MNRLFSHENAECRSGSRGQGAGEQSPSSVAGPPSPVPRPPSPGHILLTAVLFLLALLLRLYQVGSQSLWLDEGSTWQMIQHDWGFLLAELFSSVSAYPLYHVLLKAWVALAGDSEWALRFPSVLAGAAAVVAMYAAALEVQRATCPLPSFSPRTLLGKSGQVSPQRRKERKGPDRRRGFPTESPREKGPGDEGELGDKDMQVEAVSPSPFMTLLVKGGGTNNGRGLAPPNPCQEQASRLRSQDRTGLPTKSFMERINAHFLLPFAYPLTAALLLLVSPFAIWYAQEVKVYSLFLLLATLVLWSFLRALRVQTWRGWLLAGGLALTTLFVHRFAIMLLTAAYAALLLTNRRLAHTKMQNRVGVWHRQTLTRDVRSSSPATEQVSLSPRLPSSPIPFSLGEKGGLKISPLPRGEGSGEQTLSRDQSPSHQLTHIGQWVLLLLISVGMVAAMVLGLGSEGASTGAHIPAGPPLALWLTFVRFSVDRGPGEFPWWWLLPWGGLTLWGLVLLMRDARTAWTVLGTSGQSRTQRREERTDGGMGDSFPSDSAEQPQTPAAPSRTMSHAPLVLACFLVMPLLLFLAQLVFTRFYETRYLMLIFPAWILTLAYPIRKVVENGEWRMGNGRKEAQPTLQRSPVPTLARSNARPFQRFIAPTLVAGVVLVSGAVLLQPDLGLFSGDPVKEEFRDAFHTLAARVHPDDVIILHPAYMQPLYDYYMHRFSADPPPPPALFAAFKQGQTEFTRRDWDAARRESLAGHYRSFLVIAPDHARTVDIPNKKYDDEYGLVGIYYQYSREVKKWPCGIWRFNGVHLYCQESPEAYETGEVMQPATRMGVRFGEHLDFLGYTLKATTEDGSGVYRAGGVVPISLFWEVTQQIEQDYSVFLHLCQDCSQPPLASSDGQPLNGYLPTSTWLPRKPARDDRAIPLPPDMPPGRYTLLLGMYHPDNPAPAARLPLGGGQVLAHHRLVLGEVEVVGGR